MNTKELTDRKWPWVLIGVGTAAFHAAVFFLLKKYFQAALFALLILGFVLFDILTTVPEQYTDPANYEEDMARWSKWISDEEIWPERLSDAMNVIDYKMVYYNPWDAQYLGYLVIDYSPEDYAAERSRLEAYPSTEYIGYYSVEEEKTYKLLAVEAHEYYGFVYALTDGRSRIIYAEQLFCNYFMDLNYKKYIPEEYLLDGFDASNNNPYRKMRMREWR